MIERVFQSFAFVVLDFEISQFVLLFLQFVQSFGDVLEQFVNLASLVVGLIHNAQRFRPACLIDLSASDLFE